jgi:hypothetical protein
MAAIPFAPRPDRVRRSLVGIIALTPILSACGGPSVLRQAGLQPVSPVGQPASVPAPDIRVGDEWRYVVRAELTGLAVDSARIRVVGIEPDGYSVVESWQEGGTINARYDRNLNPLRSGTAVYTPAYPRYAFPLSIGKTWRGATLARIQSPQGGGSVRQTLSAKVIAWERAIVPAGTFTAHRHRRRLAEPAGCGDQGKQQGIVLVRARGAQRSPAPSRGPRKHVRDERLGHPAREFHPGKLIPPLDPPSGDASQHPRGRFAGRTRGVERVKGIEPSYAAWEAAVLPLNYTRVRGEF